MGGSRWEVDTAVVHGAAQLWSGQALVVGGAADRVAAALREVGAAAGAPGPGSAALEAAVLWGSALAGSGQRAAALARAASLAASAYEHVEARTLTRLQGPAGAGGALRAADATNLAGAP